jgi:hypothetical protein
MAVANVPAPEAIDRLIRFAASGGRRYRTQKALAREALIYATGEKVRGDVDAWRSWWNEHRKTFDFQAAAERRERDRQAAKDKTKKRKNRKKKDEG